MLWHNYFMAPLITKQQALQAISELEKEPSLQSYLVKLGKLEKSAHGKAAKIIKTEINEIQELDKELKVMQSPGQSFFEYDKAVDKVLRVSTVLGREVVARDNLKQVYTQQINPSQQIDKKLATPDTNLVNRLKFLSAQMKSDLNNKEQAITREHLRLVSDNPINNKITPLKELEAFANGVPAKEIDYNQITDVEILNQQVPVDEQKDYPEVDFLA